MQNIHIPVLVKEVIDVLEPKKGENYLDVTAGFGGHARKILNLTSELETSVLIDRDKTSIEFLTKEYLNNPIEIIKNDFYHASLLLLKELRHFDIIFADLGISSLHINDQDRGFSFRHNSELDMRMDQDQKIDAKYILNTYSEKKLREIIKNYGDEPKAGYIAREIVLNRPINTTDDLAAICYRAWPGFRSKVNPATRTFQAIRIEVNQELKLIEDSLPIWIKLLNPGGRLAIITFHSLEDRLVKNFFNSHAGNRYDDELKFLVKKPIIPDQNELNNNPRARSAKLRAVVKK